MPVLRDSRVLALALFSVVGLVVVGGGGVVVVSVVVVSVVVIVFTVVVSVVVGMNSNWALNKNDEKGNNSGQYQ